MKVKLTRKQIFIATEKFEELIKREPTKKETQRVFDILVGNIDMDDADRVIWEEFRDEIHQDQE